MMRFGATTLPTRRDLWCGDMEGSWEEPDRNKSQEPKKRCDPNDGRGIFENFRKFSTTSDRQKLQKNNQPPGQPQGNKGKGSGEERSTGTSLMGNKRGQLSKATPTDLEPSCNSRQEQDHRLSWCGFECCEWWCSAHTACTTQTLAHFD